MSHRIFQVLAAVGLMLLSRPAHAWQDMNYGMLNDHPTSGACMPGTGFPSCIVREVRYVRAENGTVAVRLHARTRIDRAELNQLFATYNITPERFMSVGARDGIVQSGVGFAVVAPHVILQGLKSEDGRSQLLPANFLRVYPLSDRWAVVQAVNFRWYLASLGSATPEIKPLGISFNGQLLRYGRTADKPFTLILRQTNADSSGKRSYVLLGPDGTAALTVSDVVINEGAGIDFYSFSNGQFGFPIQPKDGPAVTMFVDGASLEPVSFGPPLVIGQSRIYSPRRGVADTMAVYPLLERGQMPSGHGAFSRSMYAPLSPDNGSIVGADGNAGDLLGLVPYEKIGSGSEPGPRGSAIIGWLTVHGDDARRYYKLILARPRTTDYRREAVTIEDLHPVNVARYARDYTPEMGGYMPLADVWIGTLPDSDVNQLFAGVPQSQRLQSVERLAVRFFEDPTRPMTSAVTDWIDVGAFSEAGLRQAWEERATRPSHPTSPEALIYPLLVSDLEKRWAFVQQLRSDQASREFRRALLAELDRSFREGRMTVDQRAAYLLSNGRTDSYYSLALQHGGRHLQNYLSSFGSLRSTADANTVCRRFGQQSQECGWVAGWAQRTDAEQRAQAEAVARERQRNNPGSGGYQATYRSPDAWKPRCYPGPERTVCFYN